MARSPKDDPRYNEMKHNAWNYRAETAENCAPGALNDRKQAPIAPNTNELADNSMYANTNFVNDVFMKKHPYNVPTGDAAVNMDDKIPFNNVPRPNQNYGNAMLNLGNGQLVRVFYDENNQQLIFPMSNQYELFNHNSGVRDSPLHSQPSHLFTLNDCTMNNNVHVPPTTVPNAGFQDNLNTHTQNLPTSNFLNDLLGNLEPNSTGTYSPFGQNYPLNHPDASNLNILPNNPILETSNLLKAENSPKRNENSPLADTSNKKRIVAEVKPMRPSYSDVLAKNTKNNIQTEVKKVKPQNIETKPVNKPNAKLEKHVGNAKHDENKHKNEKKQSTISSGSESGDVNTDDNEKHQKPTKKSKNKRSNISRKWSSLDDVNNEEDHHENQSQFVFIEKQEKPKKEKKENKSKSSDKSSILEDDFKFDEEDNSSFIYQEQTESGKSKKKKDPRSYHKTKPVQDKKKTNQTKVRRNKPGYLGLAQNYMEHWGGATWKAIAWFFYLLSDICGMSLHLSFDL